jgi:hypothetical protein
MELGEEKSRLQTNIRAAKPGNAADLDTETMIVN